MNKLILHTFILGFVSILYSTELFAQAVEKKDSSLINQSGLFPKKLEKSLSSISIGGYYRFIANYSEMKIPYPEFTGARKHLFVGDDSQIPQLMLQIGARTSSKTSFSTDIYFWTPLTGSQNDNVKGLNLGVNLNGSHTTKYGTFNVRTGGIHWASLSPLTFGANTGYNRYSLYERNPWDPNTSAVEERYNKFYSDGALTQDVRWGQQAFQGFILDGVKLPKQLSFTMLYGKTQLNGGVLALPNQAIGGKVRKNFGTDFIGINSITSQTFTDSLATRKVSFELHTFEFNFEKNGFKLEGEVGTGRYVSPSSAKKWGEAINVKFKTPSKYTLIPLEVHYYQISPKVLNNNGAFWNTSIVEYNPEVGTTGAGSQTLLFPFASSMLGVGQMTNNRRGLELNTDVKIGKVKVSMGYSVSKEMQAFTDKISFSPVANRLALSRFWRWGFPPNVGPYGNINKVFRGVYEIVQTDTVLAKSFNCFEINAKYKTKILNKEVYFFYLGAFSSVQSKFSAVPIFSKKAYVQTYFNQLECYIKLNSKLVFTNYFGIDHIICNEHTTLDVDSKRAKNQISYSYSTGFDYYLSKNAGLYFRQRWMNNKDVNFVKDRYQGFESTVELKIYF